jgi:uncharacterized membrane protein YdfJ with MMPL/SSD domain
MKSHITGDTAVYTDFSRILSSKLPLFVSAIVGLSFLVSAVVFRSLVVAVTAAVMNLPVTAAAFGVLVAAFGAGVRRLSASPPEAHPRPSELVVSPEAQPGSAACLCRGAVRRRRRSHASSARPAMSARVAAAACSAATSRACSLVPKTPSAPAPLSTTSHQCFQSSQCD